MNFDKFKKVTSFTMMQQVKGKAFKISTTIILIAVLVLSSLINIIPAFSSKNDNDTVSTEQSETENSISIEKIKVLNESGMSFDISSAINSIYSGVQIENIEESKDEVIKELESTDAKEMLLSINNESGVYAVEGIKPKNEEVSSDDVQLIVDMTVSTLEQARLIENGVSEENLANVMTPVSSSVLEAGEEAEGIDKMISRMLFPMVACILLFYIIYFYGYWVANSIVAEKTSRVMELLLTSTKPIELVVGKCVGMGTLAIMQFLTIIIAAIAGSKLGGYIAVNLINSSAKVIDILSIFDGISPVKLVVVVVFFILGYVLYAIFNALVGATVSKLEDLNVAIMPVSFVSIIGFYISYAAVIAGEGVISKVAAFVPFSAPFYIPATILSESVSAAEMGISLAILVVTIVLFILFTARVYSVVILQTGNRIKIKDLFRIYKTEK